MPWAPSCEPVRKTVNSLVLGVLPGHIYLLVNSQGSMQSDEKHQCKLSAGRRLLTHQGSGRRQKKLSRKLVKQWIQTFKHCLCFNPTHPGTRASWLPIRHHCISCFDCVCSGACGIHRVTVSIYCSRGYLERSLNWEAMNVFQVVTDEPV